ncbi:hypothetical protein L2E82_07193 [Cichorium intybus]|uniref:Uncharacterized protein n=1 Tax=Cichorium intybus TaxID=13427 RepID=A0ACB9G407_CICIN|nr:hypothetical protein L2E82_07193 [Cichorium intybus]
MSGGQISALIVTKCTIADVAVFVQVAGGDGTVGWRLGVVSDLKLSHPPPIATVPSGTGNNLPFAFGWGKKNPRTNPESVLKFLEVTAYYLHEIGLDMRMGKKMSNSPSHRNLD